MDGGALTLGGDPSAAKNAASGFRQKAPARKGRALTPSRRLKEIPRKKRSGFRLRAPASLTPAKRLKEIPRKESSGFRQKAPARKGRALTPSRRLNLPPDPRGSRYAIEMLVTAQQR